MAATNIVIADRFASQCAVVTGNSYDTCGTITRSDVAHLTPAQLEAMFTTGGLFADLDAWFRTQIELKACGIKTNGMYEWIMSGMEKVDKNLITKEKVQKGPGLLYPFIKARQESVINTDFWAVVTGAANSGYTGNSGTTVVGTGTAGPLTTAQKALGAAGDRVVRVVNRYGVDLDEKWFTPAQRVHIFTRTAGISGDGQWKVLASAVSDDRSYVDILVTSENAGSSAAYSTTPTAGVLLPGINNVNDYENWCYNRPTVDGRKIVPFFYQTLRRQRCVDSEYRAIYARLIESNQAFREFGDLDMTERNAQDERNAQKEFVHAFFFNKPISANQTLSLWQNLESITTVSGATIDPGTGGKVIAKRANFVGVKEQLRSCDRYRDLGGQKLNFYEFLDENYRIMDARESQGRTVTDIDWYTDPIFSANLQTAYLAYLKQESLEQLRLTVPPDGRDKYGWGFFWTTFRVKYPAGININIISHKFFADQLAAFDAEGIATASRMLLGLDLGKGGSIYYGMIESFRANRTTGQIDELARIDSTFACTLKNITFERTLYSETGTVVVGCPANSLWIQGIGDGVPITTGRTAGAASTYTDLYAILGLGISALAAGTMSFLGSAASLFC